MLLTWLRRTVSQIVTAARGIRRQCPVIFVEVTDEFSCVLLASSFRSPLTAHAAAHQ